MIARLLRPVLVVLVLVMPVAVPAHHGLMLWQDDVVIIEGFVSDEMDGFPHWEISVRTSDGQDWQVDIGSDFEMGRAGLKPEDLPVGIEITVEGNRPRDSDSLLLRPRRVFVGDKVYEFRGNWN